MPFNRKLGPRMLVFASILATITLASGATVRIQLIDTETDQTTPAMVCISGSDQRVHLPPDGKVLTNPSSTREFYNGISFDPDPNWIGPVRKMQGIGNNNDRSYVYGSLPSIPYWREPVTYQTSGNFSIELDPGTWRIAVDRGLETIPIVQEFTVPDENDVEVKIHLKRWINLPAMGWWSGDVHVHHPTLEEGHSKFLLSYARACDLHVVNTLEMGHHQGTDFKQKGFGQEFRTQDGDYWVVSGQEDPRSTFGHIIGLNTTHMVRDLGTYDFYDLTFKRIHEQRGALVGFAHFSWNGCDLPRGFPWYVTTGELDFIELLQFSKLNTIDYYDYLNLGFRLTAAAGSDAPWGSTIGEVRTYVHTGPKLDVDAWFTNLKKGRSFVTNGPALEFTVDNLLPGAALSTTQDGSIQIKGKVLSHPDIGTPTALSLISNEGTIHEVINTNNSSMLDFEITRTIKRSQWLVLSAVCDNNALAHTSPIYVSVGDQPTWCPDRGPAIARKQLDAIDNIAKEFMPAIDARSQGIQQRLAGAKRYYENLIDKMEESANSTPE